MQGGTEVVDTVLLDPVGTQPWDEINNSMDAVIAFQSKADSVILFRLRLWGLESGYDTTTSSEFYASVDDAAYALEPGVNYLGRLRLVIKRKGAYVREMVSKGYRLEADVIYRTWMEKYDGLTQKDIMAFYSKGTLCDELKTTPTIAVRLSKE